MISHASSHRGLLKRDGRTSLHAPSPEEDSTLKNVLLGKMGATTKDLKRLTKHPFQRLSSQNDRGHPAAPGRPLLQGLP